MENIAEATFQAIFLTCFSGCAFAAFLALLFFALRWIAQWLESKEPVPVLAFRVPGPLRDVARSLSEASRGSDLSASGPLVFGSVRVGENAALLLRPSVQGGGLGFRSFDGAVFLWKEASGETLALFLSEPITAAAAFRPLRLEALRAAARALAEAFGRISGLPFEELPEEEAERLRDRLRTDPGRLGRQFRAVERILLLQTSISPQLARRAAILGGAAGLSALFTLAPLAVLLSEESGVFAVFPTLALLSAAGGVLLFSLMASHRKASSLPVDDLDPDAFREEPDLPWWAVAMVVASGPIPVLLGAALVLLGGESASFLPAFGAMILLAIGVPFGAALFVVERRGEREEAGGESGAG